jgi:hypothetical protein
VHVIVDAANVVGSRPDGWWRDRAAAARRLADEIVAALSAGTLGDVTVHLVVEGAAARADLPEHPDLVIVRAPADGDTTIAALAAELVGEVQVVTADRGLRERVQAAGATTTGPHTFLRAVH